MKKESPNQKNAISNSELYAKNIEIGDKYYNITPNQPLHSAISQVEKKKVCAGLIPYLNDLDIAARWNAKYYVPLKAEVEIQSADGIRKAIHNLLTAIQTSNDRLFLLIGEPGSGKSVALRKLCLDLLELGKLGKSPYIPIYVNLKNWCIDCDWKQVPPCLQDLVQFVKRTLTTNKDPYLTRFFEQNYEQLDQNGDLFFILDSFDEIPQVLGVGAASQLIEDLTKIVRTFLLGSKTSHSKGLLASRAHRMPNRAFFQATCFLQIRPFEIEQIERCLRQRKQVHLSAKQLLSERPDLFPSLRNPFIMSLLVAYLEKYQNQLPQHTAELFADYVQTAILSAKARFEANQSSKIIPYDAIMSIAMRIALLSFEQSGFQLSRAQLCEAIEEPHFEAILQILQDSYLARGDEHQFSFVHRRFYEYFMVQNLLQNKIALPPLASIPTDSIWRDTLVLYCQVAPIEEAALYAEYCFLKIRDANDIRDMESRRCLVFLTEAFRNRKQCFSTFDELWITVYLIEAIKKDYLPDVKFAAECIGILENNHLEMAAHYALKYKNSWVSETTLRACRHLNEISPAFEKILIENLEDNTIGYIPAYNHGYNSKRQANRNNNMSLFELQVSLSLSEAFYQVKQRLDWLVFESTMKRNNFWIMGISCFLSIISVYLLPIERLLIKPISFDNKIILVKPIWAILVAIGFLLSNIFQELKLRKHFNNKILIREKTIIRTWIQKWVEFIPQFVFMMLLYFIFWVLYYFFKCSKETLLITGITGAAIVMGIMLLSVVWKGIKLIPLYLKEKRILINLNKAKCNQRPYIYEIYEQLDGFFSYQNQFLTYLEENITEVTGEWPDNGKFLTVTNWNIRLAKLEERWKEASTKSIEN